MMQCSPKKQALDMQRGFKSDAMGLYNALTLVKKG